VSFSINTNVASLSAQNYLRINSNFQEKTINRVTSGLRIVQSGDDAAGLAIANGYRSDQAVLTQGIRNANDGLSQLQIIDGGMNNISQLLDRARTLATQSATGTFTGDRSVLNDEFQSVLGEINRQAQAIGLNTGGMFAKNLQVFIGGGLASNGISATENGSVSVDLSRSTIDTRSLGLQGMQASGVAGTDIGAGSPNTSLSAILANSANTASEATPNFTTFYLKGPGFDSQGVKISVNTQNLGGTNDLVASINSALQNAASSGTQEGTALKNAQVTASVVTDSTGKQQLAFTSSVAGFQVAAGDQMANALMGNFAQNASIAGTDTNPTVDTSSNHTLTFHFDGSSSAVTVSVTSGSATSKGQIVADLNANSAFHAAATASLQDNQIVIKSNNTGASSQVVVNHTALSDSLGLSAGSDVTQSAAAASTGASLTTTVQGAGAVAGGQNLIGTDTGATASITSANNTLILSVGTSGTQTLTLAQGTNLTKAQIASDINAKIVANGNFTGANAVTASVVNNQIVLTAGSPGKTVTMGNGTSDATLGFTNNEASTGTTVAANENITLQFQGGGLTSPVKISLNAITGGSTTVSQVLADLQSKIAGSSQLAAAGISLSTSTAGNNLVFTGSQGQQFEVQATGDVTNVLGLGSFAPDAAGDADYTTLQGAAYSTGVGSGSGTANLEISLNGQASSSNLISANLAGGDAAAGSTSGAVTFSSGVVDMSGNAGTAKVSLRIDGGQQIDVSVGTSATTSIATILGDFNTAFTGAGVSATASLDQTGHIVITSGSKGATSSVEILAAGAGASDTNALSKLGLSAGVSRGTNASGSNVVQQLNAAIAQNSSLVKAGLQASWNGGSGTITLSSSNNSFFRVNGYGSGNVGFGNTGASFTGNQESAAPATSPDFESQGASATHALGFSDMLYAGDKQTVSITATDAQGAKHSIGVTLENDSTLRNARTIDEAVSAINTALQQSNDSTLQQIVAVKEDNGGAQSIRFISGLSSFQVAVGNTGGGTGIQPPAGNVDSATMMGTGSNASVVDQNSAENAVTALADAVSMLGKAQAVVGKGENQFNYAINLAQSQMTNLATAESGIRDADLASEAANLTKAQILLQAGVAALAQANSAPQAVLSLLKG